MNRDGGDGLPRLAARERYPHLAAIPIIPVREFDGTLVRLDNLT